MLTSVFRVLVQFVQFFDMVSGSYRNLSVERGRPRPPTGKTPSPTSKTLR